MPLHPQVQRLIDSGFVDLPSPAAVGAPAVRAHLEHLCEQGAPYLEPIRSVRDVAIPRGGGSITARVLRPSDARDLPVLVWCHGGGWATGSHRTHDGVLRPVAERAGCVVVIPDYRLAPEHPFPAAFDDCTRALQWAFENADELGGDRRRIAIGGDSAGGNLAAAVAIAARDTGPPLAAQVLVYPAVDDDFGRPSMVENASGYMLETAEMEWFRDAYLPNVADRDDWRAYPLKAESLARTAPALVLTAEYDPLRDEGEAYAQRLAHEGVEAVAIRYDGLTHGFFGLWGLIEPARDSLVDTVEFLRRRFGDEESA